MYLQVRKHMYIIRIESCTQGKADMEAITHSHYIAQMVIIFKILV